MRGSRFPAAAAGQTPEVLEHPERPEAVARGGRRGREWAVYLVIALAAGVVTALGVPWWLTIPVALALELVCLIALQRR